MSTRPFPVAVQHRASVFATPQKTKRPVGSASEMVEEAESQHNCLATYADAMAEGMTDIWLMRRSDRPDESHVTSMRSTTISLTHS